MGFDLSGKGGVRSDINITPLVDVVLVLLIIFMVVTPMMTRGKPVELPRSTNADPPVGDEPLIVSAVADGRIFLGNDAQPVLPAALSGKLREAAAAGRRLVVHADSAADYGNLRSLLGLAQTAKVHRLSLAVQEVRR